MLDVVNYVNGRNKDKLSVLVSLDEREDRANSVWKSFTKDFDGGCQILEYFSTTKYDIPR